MSRGTKTPGLDPALYRYMLEHSSPPDAVARALIEDTEAHRPRESGMQIPPEQGAFLTLLTRLSGARFAVEVGTFTGYSALCLARGLPPKGKLLTIDNDERAEFGRPYWERAGVDGKVELRIGDATEVLRSLPGEPGVDLAFVDADKKGYHLYHEELLRRLAPGGALLYDNTFAGGDVLNVLEENPEGWAAEIHAFNERLARDGRIEAVMLPVGDGLTLAWRRDPSESPKSPESPT